MYNEIITLVKEQKTVNDYGDQVIETTERVVFAKLQSITQNEFYQAQAIGLKPEIKFVLSDFLEYEDEKLLKYTTYKGSEELYTIIRTYRKNNELELVCKRGID